LKKDGLLIKEIIRGNIMKSSYFTKMKRIRCKNSLKRDVKRLKRLRVRKDRHHTKKILHVFQDNSNLEYYILLNNGAWFIA